MTLACVSERLSRALACDTEMEMTASELGVYRTYASLLWRRPHDPLARRVPSDRRGEFIHDYASLLTLLRLTPVEITEEARRELREVFYGKYPELRGVEARCYPLHQSSALNISRSTPAAMMNFAILLRVPFAFR
jgi:hypothetical protein